MMSTRRLCLNLIGLLLLASIHGCSQEAKSGPNYVYKPAPSAGAAAKIGEETITEGQLFKGIESDLYDAEMKVFEIKMNHLKTMMLEKFMAKDSRKKDLSNDQYLEKFITQDVKVTTQEIETFINERKIPKEHINDQMKERVQKFLEIEKKKVAIEAWIAKQSAESPVEIYFHRPERPVFDVQVGDAPYAGNVDAKVTLVEFSDFQCPYCAKGAEIIQELKQKYGDKLKVVFKNYPLPFHNHAKVAAEAALCAHEQKAEAFWKMHDHMFKNQGELDRAGLSKAAAQVGINADQFNKCLDSHKHEAKVDKDIEQGGVIGVKSTPTFFINGKLINGAQPVEVFADLIDEEMKK